VQIVRARLMPFRLRPRRPLATAHGRLRVREGILVRLDTDAGLAGHGEATPLASFGHEPVSRSREALDAGARALLDRDPRELDSSLDTVQRQTDGAPAARAALDCALHDLAARCLGVSLAALLRTRAGTPGTPPASVPTSALLTGDTPEEAARSARGAVARGFRTLKLKLGTATLADDLSRASAVRRAAGPDVSLRLDANGAWDEATASEALALLARIDPAYVEQPVASHDLEALQRIRGESPVPVAADESVRDVHSAREILRRKAADVLIVKPAAVGGLRAARRIAADAHAAGVDVVVTDFLDSGVGGAAALQLAASLPGPPHAAGVGSSDLFERDLVCAGKPAGGDRLLPREPGLGVTPDPDACRVLAIGPAREVRG
jgi:o-succinylbenzoate synthase